MYLNKMPVFWVDGWNNNTLISPPFIFYLFIQSSCMFMSGGGCKFTKLNLQYFYTLNYEKTHFWTSCETSTHYYDHLHNRILLTLFYLFIFSISKCTLTWIIKLNTFFFRNDGIGSFITLFIFNVQWIIAYINTRAKIDTKMTYVI